MPALTATPEARAEAARRAVAFCERSWCLYTQEWIQHDEYRARVEDSATWIYVANRINAASTEDPWFLTNCHGSGRDCDILSHVWYVTVNRWCEALF